MINAEWLSEYNVSRETIDRLKVYARLLKKWNSSINLVAPSTLPMLWSRHFYDSFQIYEHAGKTVIKWCDLGSGAGFPGMITAIIASELDPKRHITCIESDVRKATFLRTVARELKINVQIKTSRIEHTEPEKANVISARALAPLTKLLNFADRHLLKDGYCLFLKGENYQCEIEEALENWNFTIDTYESKTNSKAVVLKIGEIKRG